MARGRVKGNLSVSDSEGEAKDKVMMLPETDLESIAEVVQDVASLDAEDPRDIFIQLQNFIVNSNVVDCTREMCEISHKFLALFEQNNTEVMKDLHITIVDLSLTFD